MPPPSRAKDLKPPRTTGGAIIGIAPIWPSMVDFRALLARIACRLSRTVRRTVERRRSSGPKQSAETWLDHMSDHLLRDIGVSRMEISHGKHRGRACRPPRAVRRPATPPPNPRG
jgi:uncharacterized protein YjiS (DUF1127 family)